MKYRTLWGKASYLSTNGLTKVSHKFSLKNRLGKFSERVSMAPGVQASHTMMGGRSTGGQSWLNSCTQVAVTQINDRKSVLNLLNLMA